MAARVKIPVLALVVSSIGFLPAAEAVQRASVVTEACSNSTLDPQERFARFKVQMYDSRGRNRILRIRPVLQMRMIGTTAWVTDPSAVAPVNRWTTGEPKSKTLVRVYEVRGLKPGYSYRLKTNFKWLSSSRRLLKQVYKSGVSCAIRDFRPNLSIDNTLPTFTYDPDSALASVGFSTTLAGSENALKQLQDKYPDGITVHLSVGNTVIASQLRPMREGSEAMSLVGASCQSGDQVTITIDPSGEVDERSEADNALKFTCPPLPE